MAELTAKQRRFVEEYLIDLNVTKAAERAGYSKKSACRIGLHLFQKTHVLAYLQERQGELSQKTKISQERVLRELAAIGFSKVTDYAYVTESGVGIMCTEGMCAEQVAALASIKQGVNGVEVKLHDKLKALELLGKHLGMFTEKVMGDESETGVIVLGEVKQDG